MVIENQYFLNSRCVAGPAFDPEVAHREYLSMQVEILTAYLQSGGCAAAM